MSDGNAGIRPRIGIYVRESRDDNGENIETIETQRDLLVKYVQSRELGTVEDVYCDDNVSGSAFERDGLNKLRSDVIGGRIDLLVVKDLSRLGRNNAKTLLFLDFLEENGVRIITFDGRYDSMQDNDTVGIETWYNERYIRDISRKIRASLRFKIEKGDYLGHAPFGYVKSAFEKNRLSVKEEEALVVRMIYGLYRKGSGYSTIAGALNGKSYPGPGGRKWNEAAIRRILCSRVYMGDTVQGVSEKVSFKSRKTRRKPEERWVVTGDTHEAIVTREEYLEVQNIRKGKCHPNSPHKGVIHPLRGMLFCGRCGSAMYSRMGSNGSAAYICGNYYKAGRRSCSSHYVYESAILGYIAAELKGLCRDASAIEGLRSLPGAAALFRDDSETRLLKIERQLEAKLKQQEMLYADRLEGRIGEQLFVRMNNQLEMRLANLREEHSRLFACGGSAVDIESCLDEIAAGLEKGRVSYEAIRLVMKRATVYDPGDPCPYAVVRAPGESAAAGEKIIVIDFRMNKV